MKKLFEGTGVALVTPFKDEKVDFFSMHKLLTKCLDENAQAVVILATTGEGTTINDEERKQIITFCKSVIKDKAKLIVGTGNNNFEICHHNTLQAKKLGADATLVVTPYYNKTTQAGLVEYYQKLSQIEIPIIMYNVPARTGLNLELETIKQIIKTNKWVYGIKESTCDINRIIKLHQICKNKIAIYSGEDSLNLIFYSLGGSGTISVTANVFCEDVQRVFEAAQQNDFATALKLQNKLQPTNEILFCETNPIPIKYMLKQLEIIVSDKVRSPLVNLSLKHKKQIDNLIKKCH